MTIESSANSQSSLTNRHLKVAVLCGGIGEERDISLQSGRSVAAALNQTGLNVIESDIDPDNMDILGDDEIDVFFIALHGKFGEDGRLQQIFEDKSLLYTGSGPAASTLAFDKMESKKAFVNAGIDTPAAIEFNHDDDSQKLENHLSQFAQKFVVKPLRQGSSVGISILSNPKEAIANAQKASCQFGDCMIEQFIPGREITVGILCDQALPIVEVRPRTGFYSYHAKYLDEKTEYLFDTIEEPVLTAKIQAAALACFNALGCRHFARVDFILGDDQKPYVLEVNTIPGFTNHSLLPKAAAKAGFSMSDLCAKIIEAALDNRNTHSVGIKTSGKK
jgi:D-alanine-D-alanine ligase